MTNSIGMQFVSIDSGTFVMGQDGPETDHQMMKHPEKFDDADADEKPAHRVTISQPFQMSVMEVTLGQYRQFKPDHLKHGTDSDAVTQVSWKDAVSFCEWLSAKEQQPYRLPTEAEWEYACRSGSSTLFHTGDSLPPGFQKWSSDIGFRDRYFKGAVLPTEYRTEVSRLDMLRGGQTPANAWGLKDMHGNVSEWCADWYGPYQTGSQTDALGPNDGDFRVFRGGHHSIFTRVLRSANRSAWLPESSSDRIGFRVVLGLPPKGANTPPAPTPLNGQNVSQSLAKIPTVSEDAPLFEGPRPFVKIARNSYGPLFFRHNHSPSITECPNGDLLAVWYSCANEDGAELSNVASRLRRGTSDWEPASVFWDGPDVNDHAPKVWWDGEKTLFNFVRGLRENLVRTSTDNGATWSKARLIQPPGEFGNQVIRLHDGTLVLGHDSRQVSLVTSTDAGESWTFNDVKQRVSDFQPGGQGFRYPGIHAPMIQLKDGGIMAMSRLDPPEDQEKFQFKTPVSFTADLGKTWAYEASVFPAISSVQRAAMIRLQDGSILFCSFTDQWRDWKNRRGMTFKNSSGEFTGFGLFVALSYDEGKTWPIRRLVTPGGKKIQVNTIDQVEFTMSDTYAEPCGYLAVTQTRDGAIQLITSKNHYWFNTAWIKALPSHSN
ncbi:formylglycine-generating enzyme required for sulfatase activity [Prosthecobacter fusiformis]|uniref:Formylglycine-generating enzyme required for sulfatase activity n=1 Tax=Prosthecobacter fusiformis TaxID=48464 RepID=A0A4V3FIC6_9BACT|nr:SUMF1/EgtB/PvdO family nonheme iron enzyme [Prosthecobacter fusiformis]TDU81903.1 formylglycine-generating enzyme required for sulfatase activity [Prosthecobacter fusiformis]